MRTDDLAGAVWLPGDGKANPADITQALAKRRTHRRRAHRREDAAVTGVAPSDGRSPGSRPREGPVACEIVVDLRRAVVARRSAGCAA